MSPSRGGEEDPSVLFRTLCGGHWRFCVVTAFLIVVYICRRGLVPGLGHPRILASDFTQTDGGHRPLSTWDSRVSHRCGLRCLYTVLAYSCLRGPAGVSAWGSWGEASCIHEEGLRPLRYQGRLLPKANRPNVSISSPLSRS